MCCGEIYIRHLIYFLVTYHVVFRVFIPFIGLIITFFSVDYFDFSIIF